MLRNRRRALYAIVGVMLAVSMVSGSLIAVDSASYGVLRDRLAAAPVDYYGQGYASDPYTIDAEACEQTVSTIHQVVGVEDASYVVSQFGWSFVNDAGVSYQGGPYGWSGSNSLMFLPSDPDPVMDRYRIDGAAPSPGTVAVPEPVALALGLSVGDDITCSYASSLWDPVNSTALYSYINLSFEISQIWTQDGVTEAFWQWWYPESDVAGSVTIAGTMNPVVMLVEDAQVVVEQFSEMTMNEFAETYLVWVDRDEFISLGNYRLSIYELNALEARLDRAGVAHSVYFSCALTSIIGDVGDELSQKKIMFVGLSLPVIVLGIYLSVVGIDMGMTDRRREIGVLKSRGASNRQVFVSLISESVLLGAIAGAAGLLVGTVLSRLLVFTVSSMFGASGSEVTASSFYLSYGTVAAAIMFGVILMFVSAYRPMKRVSRMPVAESLHQYTPKTVKVVYRARWDIAALSLVALSVISVLWLHDFIQTWMYSFIIYSIALLIVVIGWAIIPVVPFLLSVSVVRLVTRGSRSLYTRFTWFFRTWTKELHYIVEKNIARNPKRASNIGIIVSLAIAFGLFVSITMESEISYAENVVLYEVGADIKYTGTPMYNGTGFTDVDYDMIDLVGSIDGVRSHSMFTIQYVSVDDLYYGSMACIETDEILDVVDVNSDWYTGDGSEDIRDLNENGTVFASAEFAERSYLTVGDSVDVSITMSSSDGSVDEVPALIELRLVGLVNQLPGLSCDLYVDEGTLSFIGTDRYPASTTVGLFVDVNEGADDSDVAADVRGVCRLAGLYGYTLVAEEQIDLMSVTPEFRTIRDFLYLEYAMSMVVLTFGVGLVLFVTVWDRQVELACIMARGSSAGQMRRLLMGESLSLMTLGVVVGVGAGLLSAYLYGLLVEMTDSSYVPRDLVISWVSLSMIIAAVVSFLVASLLATYSAGRIRLSEVLRIRGG